MKTTFHSLFILFLFLMFSSCEKKQEEILIKGVFIHENITVPIPNYFKQDPIVKSKWVDEYGVTLSTQTEYSTAPIEDYLKNSLKMIQRVYPTYKIKKKFNVEKNKLLLISEAKIGNKEMMFNVLVMSFDSYKLIFTVAGTKGMLTDNSRYYQFLTFVCHGVENKNEGHK